MMMILSDFKVSLLQFCLFVRLVICVTGVVDGCLLSICPSICVCTFDNKGKMAKEQITVIIQWGPPLVKQLLQQM